MRKLPTKENYEDFLEDFTKKVSRRFPDCCFYLYGSATDGRCVYGRSDIDGGLILDSGVVIPIKDILVISELLATTLQKNRVETQFNLLDRQTNKDGRFLSYTTDYTDWVKESSKVLFGPDYIKEMNGLDKKTGVLYTSAFNFRKVRNSALYFMDRIMTDRKRFQRNVLKCLKNVVNLPKKLIWLRGERIIASKTSARKRLSEMLEDVDLSFVDRVNYLFGRPAELYRNIENENAPGLMLDSLTTMEQMIEAYLKHFPEHSERELTL